MSAPSLPLRLSRFDLLAGALVLTVVAGCGSDGSGPPAPAPPAALRAIGGDGQSGTVGGVLAEPLVVRVEDARGRPLAKVAVSWRVSAGGGSIRGLDAASDSAGRARAEWTLGTTAGEQGAEAAVAALTPVQLHATAAPGAVTAVALEPDSVRLAAVGDSARLAATAKDAYGNVVAGASIGWSTLDPAVVAVAAGVVRGVGPGTGRVVARSGSAADTSRVVVLPGAGARLVLAPTDWRLPVGTTVRIQATFDGARPADVEWSAGGIPGGSAQVGTIAADGTYRAPAAVPPGGHVTVAATLRADPAVRGEAPIAISASAVPPAVIQLVWDRRAIRHGVTDSARMEVDLAGDGALALDLGNSRLPLLPVRTGRFALTLPRALLLRSYVVGDLHAFVGYMELTSAAGAQMGRYNMFVNVADATVPAATVTALAPDAQASAHMANLRVEDTTSAAGVAAIRRFYELYPDDYDFLALVEPVLHFQNRYYAGIRNSTSGLGLPMFDNSAASGGYGSAARLQGVVHYPIDDYFDLGEHAANHEIGHRWMVFLRNFTGNGSHWPMSDLAHGPMGFAIPGSGGVGGDFTYDLLAQPDGRFRVVCEAPHQTFSDLELYLMGLLPADSVGDHWILADQKAVPSCDSMVAANRLRLADVTALNGARSPAAGSDRRDFRVATIVLSIGRLLTREEMDFFDQLAARGEARQPLRFTSGFASGTTLPFYLATGGRGTLTTTLR